jgi:hypothetical protein
MEANLIKYSWKVEFGQDEKLKATKFCNLQEWGVLLIDFFTVVNIMYIFKIDTTLSHLSHWD